MTDTRPIGSVSPPLACEYPAPIPHRLASVDDQVDETPSTARGPRRFRGAALPNQHRRSRRRILCGPKKLDRMSTAIRGAHLLYFELRGPGEFEKILTMVSMWRISSEITSKSLFLGDERSSVRSMVKSRILTRCERVPDTVGNTAASCRSGQVFRTGGGARGSAGVVVLVTSTLSISPRILFPRAFISSAHQVEGLPADRRQAQGAESGRARAATAIRRA